jgi:transcriptional regulator with XRE-family HTH domain
MGNGTLPRSIIYIDLGARIRDERERRNVSQELLADRVGLTRTSITNIEKGRQQVLLHTLLEIARALNLKPTRLLPDVSQLAQPNVPPNLSKNVSRWIERSLERAK